MGTVHHTEVEAVVTRDRTPQSKLVVGSSNRPLDRATMPPLPTPIVRRPRQVVTRTEWALLQVRKCFLGVTGISMGGASVVLGLLLMVVCLIAVASTVLTLMQILATLMSSHGTGVSNPIESQFEAQIVRLVVSMLFVGFTTLGARGVAAMMNMASRNIDRADNLDRHVMLASQVADIPVSHSLLRASVMPDERMGEVLLRPAASSTEVPAEELVRPAMPEATSVGRSDSVALPSSS